MTLLTFCHKYLHKEPKIKVLNLVSVSRWLNNFLMMRSRISIRGFVVPSVNPSIWLSSCPSGCPSVHPTIHPTIRPSVCPFLRPSIHPSLYPSVLQSLFIHLSVRPPVHSFIHSFNSCFRRNAVWLKLVYRTYLISRWSFFNPSTHPPCIRHVWCYTVCVFYAEMIADFHYYCCSKARHWCCCAYSLVFLSIKKERMNPSLKDIKWSAIP